MSEEESRNYTHVLLENLQARLHELAFKVDAGFERDITQDKEMELRLAMQILAQDTRLRVVERMCWVALGGLGVVGTIVTTYGHNIMKALVG